MANNAEMKSSTTSKERVENYVVKINDAVASVKSSSKKVFELLMDANLKLTNWDYSLVKQKINVDKSTINKIEKIFTNSVVMNNISTLPVSWGTLHEISLIDEDALQSAIDAGKVSSISTRAEVKKVRAELATASPDFVFDEDTYKVAVDEVFEIEDAAASAEVDEEPTAMPAVRINLELKKEISLTSEEVRKEVEYFAAELSKEIFEVEILYNDVAELPKAA